MRQRWCGMARLERAHIADGCAHRSLQHGHINGGLRLLGTGIETGAGLAAIGGRMLRLCGCLVMRRIGQWTRSCRCIGLVWLTRWLGRGNSLCGRLRHQRPRAHMPHLHVRGRHRIGRPVEDQAEADQGAEHEGPERHGAYFNPKAGQEKVHPRVTFIPGPMQGTLHLPGRRLPRGTPLPARGTWVSCAPSTRRPLGPMRSSQPGATAARRGGTHA